MAKTYLTSCQRPQKVRVQPHRKRPLPMLRADQRRWRPPESAGSAGTPIDVALAGTAFHSSGGDTSSPSQVYLVAIRSPSRNAELNGLIVVILIARPNPPPL